MIFENLIIKIFLCQCDKVEEIFNFKQLYGNRIVVRCSKCKKRVYGNIIFDPHKQFAKQESKRK